MQSTSQKTLAMLVGVVALRYQPLTMCCLKRSDTTPTNTVRVLLLSERQFLTIIAIINTFYI